MVAKVRTSGPRAFEDILEALDCDTRKLIDEQAQQLLDSGIGAVLLGDAGYPQHLASSRSAPAALFVNGPLELLDQHGIGMCGSRHSSSEGLRAAHACAEVVTHRGYAVISGYAKGVDLVAHSAALASGGNTVIVLAEGISHFRIRKGEFARLWDGKRAVVISQFAPDQKWFVSGAMARNAVISGLSTALVVVEAGETGGTLAAGQHALRSGQTVLALHLFGAPSGNRALIEKGAKVIRSRRDLEKALDYLDAGGSKQLTLM
ncbi:DNA-processing protein DprA [Mycobacterium riyadhense]|uniref:Smf/DprA SLOG domain-containing protein n=1 Tax=Mycobacterium riyadhense TaxID=486698 RepID=A0A1X2BEE6_9MYCO|nr:DNA-processing protein DprA [Mycobacterium riyadhense]MCV7148785.1 DNA-processing protein DprA [Mycobacterium riyadhense]ORW61911.1 hypothetical protein AWC22_04615 [Mycobacterium riyadhense]